MNHSNKVLKLILDQEGIHPNDILYALFLTGITPSKIAEDCLCSSQTVSQVVHGKRRSFDIATYIADKLNTTTQRLWGDAYNYTPRKTVQQIRSVASG